MFGKTAYEERYTQFPIQISRGNACFRPRDQDSQARNS